MAMRSPIPKYCLKDGDIKPPILVEDECDDAYDGYGYDYPSP
jgi:hypothetical protein